MGLKLYSNIKHIQYFENEMYPKIFDLLWLFYEFG